MVAICALGLYNFPGMKIKPLHSSIVQANLEASVAVTATETELRERADAERDAAVLKVALIREEAAAAARTAKNRLTATRSARSAAASEATSLREILAKTQEQVKENVTKQSVEMIRMHAVCEAALRDAKSCRDKLAAQSASSENNEARAAVVKQLVSVAEQETVRAVWYRSKLMGNDKEPGLSRALLMAKQLLVEDVVLGVEELREGLVFMRDSIFSARAECTAFEALHGAPIDCSNSI